MQLLSVPQVMGSTPRLSPCILIFWFFFLFKRKRNPSRAFFILEFNLFPFFILGCPLLHSWVARAPHLTALPQALIPFSARGNTLTSPHLTAHLTSHSTSPQAPNQDRLCSTRFNLWDSILHFYSNKYRQGLMLLLCYCFRESLLQFYTNV